MNDDLHVEGEIADVSEVVAELKEVEPTLDWDNVYAEVKGVVSEMPLETIVEELEVDDTTYDKYDSGSDKENAEVEPTETIIKKQARMKTNNNKKAGVHFYETANVKNRNRTRGDKNKQEKLNDPKLIEKKLKGDGKRRQRK